ncbi:MAG TPA: DUF805 domain-containing protein, partial [Azonexus sp.]|nr:DUF805 domain-containing protein [Azonexus sp.]
MTEQFRVVISGRTISGAPLADIKDAVGRVFRLQGEALERMVSGQAMIVARACDKAAAEKLHARLQALDLEARIDALPAVAPAPEATPPAPPEKAEAKPDELFALAGPAVSAPVANPGAGAGLSVPPAAVAAEVVCPKCGEAQPKRTLCRQCGLDMPRYLAAQEAAEREARAEREAEREARRQSPGRVGRGAGEPVAGVLGLGFSGRLGRLDYFSASLLSSTLWLLLVLAAVATGKMALAGLGLFLSAIYSIRCIVLRLHDTGKSGWLALIVLVPVLGALMALALLFMGSDGDENEYGSVATNGAGRRAILVLVALFVVSGLSYRSLSQSPEKAMRFLEAMSAGQGKSAVAADDD